jgi:hypothetical protein
MPYQNAGSVPHAVCIVCRACFSCVAVVGYLRCPRTLSHVSLLAHAQRVTKSKEEPVC